MGIILQSTGVSSKLFISSYLSFSLCIILSYITLQSNYFHIIQVIFVSETGECYFIIHLGGGIRTIHNPSGLGGGWLKQCISNVSFDFEQMLWGDVIRIEGEMGAMTCMCDFAP